MKRPTKNDLGWTAALLVFGVGGLWADMHAHPLTHWLVLYLPQWLLASIGIVILIAQVAAVGAGVGAPFRRKLLGASLVLFIMLMLSLAIYFPGRR